MVTAEIRLVIAIILAALLAWAGVTVKRWHDGYELSKDIGKTSEVLDTTGESDADRTRTQDSVARARNDYHQALNEAKRHEPEIADRADRVFPQCLRDLARARRLAREGIAPQRAPEPCTATAAQRQDVLR